MEMMTNKKALEVLEHKCDDCWWYGYGDCNYCAIATSTEAVEKQIEKRPIYNKGNFFCPKCGVEVDGAETYCPTCGQKIDWGMNK